MTISSAVNLTKSLINLSSVTPEDGGCQELLAQLLKKQGFEITHLPFGEVKNLWARRGNSAPLFVFVGHTDVVPTGPVEKWSSPPFTATEKDNYLYGRGASDMKSNIAAMVAATERFVAAYPHYQGSIAFLITSDEEGPSINGTKKVVEYLEAQSIKIDWCLVGEPSSQQKIGDMLKVGRRGSLSATLTILGKQGHIAYPHLAENSIHLALPALAELIQIQWDKGSEFFPVTSFQVSNMNAGTGANNVIPGELKLLCNFRYSPEVTAEQLQHRFEEILKKHITNYTLDWHHSGKPFLTQQGKLLDACIKVIKTNTGITPELSTSGGTSDGRFIAPLGADVVEMG
ncbi:MAG: succinyl-diaminopimelate desuccinylase, partial [Candidatus Paceibacterales bacterium]